MRLLFLFNVWVVSATLNAQVFMRPFDNAASMGMGGATIAMSDFSTGLSNDGQLGLEVNTRVMAGSAIPYTLTGWQTGYVQGVLGLGKSSGVGVGVFYNGTDLYAEQRFQGSYGRRLGEKFYLGGALDVLRNSAREYGSSTAVTMGISLLAQVLPQVWMGMKIQNPFQQSIGTDPIPTIFRVGASWKPTEIFLLAFETEKDLDRPTQVKMGVEYRPTSMLAIRAGTRAGKLARMSFGIGMRLKHGISIDVGSEWHPILGITPAAGVSWQQ
ncbi:MAG: hypothetical protein RIQ78_189 [Bacteroidota bacterium]